MAISKQAKKAAREQLNKALSGSTKTRAVAPSYAAGRAYNADLQKIIRQMSRDINRYVMPQVRADNPLAAQQELDRIKRKWTGTEYEIWADDLARKFTNQAINAGRRGFARSAPGVGVNLYGETPEINEYIEVSARANASLIESISSRHLEDVEIMVTSNMRSGVRSSQIAKQLAEKYGVTKARAKFIARDQTSKINADITKLRQQQAGFEFFKWIDSDDIRVRDRHEAIANADVGYGPGVYRWEDLPLSDSGQRISPGQDFQCRCTAKPLTKNMVENQLGRKI